MIVKHALLAATANVVASLEGEFFRGDDYMSYCGAVEYCQQRQSELAIIRNAEQNKLAAKACQGTFEYGKGNKPDDHDDPSCWLGLTEYVGTQHTPVEHQIWIWRDGNASKIPLRKGHGNKKERQYSFGYYDEQIHERKFNATDNTTTLETKKVVSQRGIPLNSFEYQNWASCLGCEHDYQSEPNNWDSCSESHTFMRSNKEWYDVNAHQEVEFYPLCESIQHATPIHDHHCDAKFQQCYYEQCENDEVGEDGSSCWAKINSSAPPKCDENAVPKYTDLEMTLWDGTAYREFTCCDDQGSTSSDKGRDQKFGLCYDDGDRRDELADFGGMLLGIFVLVGIGCCFGVCCMFMRKNDQVVSRNNQQHNNGGGVQMMNMGQQQRQMQMQVTVPPNANPGQVMMISLPSGQTMQVTVPNGARPGTTMTVQYQAAASNSYISAPQNVPSIPQNMDVPQLPQHDFDDKSTVTHVVPVGSGGGSMLYSSGAQPVAILQPVVVSQQPIAIPQNQVIVVRQ
jgi:hypothetical protein